MDAPFDACSRACCDCRRQCLKTLQLCLNKGGRYADSRLCLRLAEAMRLCQLCGDITVTFSEDAGAVAESCASECEETALLLDAFADASLARCAQALRSCAASCRAAARQARPRQAAVTEA